MESVLAVQSAPLQPFLISRGLITENLDAALSFILSNYEFIPREKAERSPEYKQIIPYAALRDRNRVFTTRRLPRSNEARLHGMLSIGIGGHINSETDGYGENILLRGLYRELGEEVYIERPGGLHFAGLVNDDTNPVGSVHLGLFFVMDVSGDLRVLETDKLEGFWSLIADLPGLADQMESWSALVTGAICPQ